MSGPSAHTLFKKSPISGSVINYQAPCTSSEGRLCNVFADLPLCNEFFWRVGLQLGELIPGELSLAEMRSVCASPSVTEQNDAATLLFQLLSHHRCIASVHLNCHVFDRYHEIICDALRESRSLRNLELSTPRMTPPASQCFAAALPHLKQLQELELGCASFNRTTIEGLCELLATTRSLTTFTVTGFLIGNEEAVVFLEGLKENVTISTLSLHTGLLSMSHCGDIFTDYLRRNQTLRRLTVTSHRNFRFKDLGPILGALFDNSTLSELSLIGFLIYIPNIKIITDVLSRNQGLKSFHISNCRILEQGLCINNLPVFPNGSILIPLWSAALAKNNTLEELTMDLSWMEPEDCSAFFRALASNKSLKKVYVPKFRHNDVARICRAIEDTKVPEFFIVGMHNVLSDTAAVHPECKVLSRIRLHRCTLGDVEPLHTTLRLLPTCSHVKSLCLEMSGPTFDDEVSSLLAHYLTGTTMLRELWLEFFSGVPGRSERSKLLRALSNNKSVCRLSFKGLHIKEDEAKMLADVLQSSRTLCYLTYCCDLQSSTALLEKLSPDISGNYMLLGIHAERHYWRFRGSWYSLNDTVRRNNSLVTRAAHFVTGTRRKYCAVAAELMQFHPGLVEKVQELASVDEEDAVTQIEGSLKSLAELHGFMCLAGVVKYTVTCIEKALNDIALHELLISLQTSGCLRNERSLVRAPYFKYQ